MSADPGTGPSEPPPLFTDAHLINPLTAEGEHLPRGASGVIVEILGAGESYIVEFFEPRHCVVTVHDGDLEVEK